MRNLNTWAFECSVALLVGVGTACSGGGEMSEDVAITSQSLCTAATLTPTNYPGNSAGPNSTVNWATTATCSGTPEYSFWVRDTNGVYTNPQPWSATSTFAWNTTGLPPGSYVVTVLVRDAAGATMAYDQYVSNYFNIIAGTPCSSMTLQVSPQIQTSVGTPVDFTSVATPCGNPEFIVYHYPPGGPWQIDSNYSTTNSTYQWQTAGATPGIHNFQIWARESGSSAQWEAYAAYSYRLLASSPCSSASISFAPNPGTVGTTTRINAAAAGCSSPTYSYYIQPPGGSYQLLQDWTTSSYANWNTTLATPGQYALQVWVRQAGSTAPYEAYIGGYYVLNSGTPTTTPLTIAGSFHQNCELTSSGKIGCWGYNAHGELGNGTTTSSNTPVVVSGITTGVSLGVGYNHACAVLQGGTVRCWGFNEHGQLGNNSTSSSSTPVQVSGNLNAVQVAAGTAHTCAALSDGSVKCWGYNSQGQLGDNTVASKLTPTTVSGLSNAMQTSAGYYHSCALLSNGSVSCWGINSGGQLGTGNTTSSRVPVASLLTSGVTQLASASGNNCALKSDHTVWCWGGNDFGTAGDGTTGVKTTPVQVSGITTAVHVAVGPYHACAALQDGTAACWGYNPYGALGNGTTTDSLVPVPVSTLTNVATVAVDNFTSCAALADGTAACWGYGGEGALGNGTWTSTSTTPVPVNAIP